MVTNISDDISDDDEDDIDYRAPHEEINRGVLIYVHATFINCILQYNMIVHIHVEYYVFRG